MDLDDREWRPITFEGTTFPATLMGISILGPILNIQDEELAEWLWRFPICKGVTKTASARTCARCARLAAELLLAHRHQVLDGIRTRLAPHGFDPESTYDDWCAALRQIAKISDTINGDCSWSAPMHPADPLQTPTGWKKFKANMERAFRKATREKRP